MCVKLLILLLLFIILAQNFRSITSDKVSQGSFSNHYYDNIENIKKKLKLVILLSTICQTTIMFQMLQKRIFAPKNSILWLPKGPIWNHLGPKPAFPAANLKSKGIQS